jgi:cytochrome c556
MDGGSRSGLRDGNVRFSGFWTNFADFYQRAAEASKLAFDASRKKRANEFKLLISQLRTACNGCHASFMKSE